MVEVIVDFDYTAQEPDELTIKKGDVIKNVTQKTGGWWEGTLNEKTGMFPDNFVKVVDKDAVILRNKKDSPRNRQCRVVFSYHQDHEDELNLKVGDVISIIGEEEEGWWRGVLNGKEGVFPSNFVEEITPPQNRPKPVLREDIVRTEGGPVLPSKPVKQQCEVRYSYKAQNEDELTLKEGDIVTILTKDCDDPGWWRGELNGKVGMFPDNFVVMLPQTGGDEKKSLSNNKVDSKPNLETPKPLASVASQRKSLETKSKPAELKQPPPPGKKPVIAVKKSPSGSGAGFLSKIKDKIQDAVDGVGGSKPKNEVAGTKEVGVEGKDISNSTFDQIERRPLLNDVRANRARAPGRRLPKSIYKEDDEDIPGVPNHSDPAKLDSSTKSEDSFKSIESTSSENLDVSSDLDNSENKPKLREWEKHKAPWLEEMKLNQAKRTSVSPVPPKPEPEQSKSSQNSPAEKEMPTIDMSKSLSDMKISPMEFKPIPKPYKTPPNELEKPAPLKSKPNVTSVNKSNVASQPLPTKPLTTTKLNSIAPKPRIEQYENVTIKSSHVSMASSHIASSSHVSTSSSNVSTSSVQLDERNHIGEPNLIELFDRLARLELKVEKQGQVIEELRLKLQVETDMRMILQEKVMTRENNVQV